MKTTPTRAPSPRQAAGRPPAQRSDGLTPNQGRGMTVAIVAIHVAALYGLMQVREFREATREIAPMFVDLIAPPEPVAPPVPPPPSPQPVQKKVQPVPLIAAAPSPTPSTFTVPTPPPDPVTTPAPAPELVVPPSPPAPPAAREPRIIPASEVQYLVRPVAEYPRLSSRNRESGRVTVLLLIDPEGLPRQVQIAKSSGFVRLDESALTAVRASRFKPSTLNGQPVAAWTNIPFDFGLEN